MITELIEDRFYCEYCGELYSECRCEVDDLMEHHTEYERIEREVMGL